MADGFGGVGEGESGVDDGLIGGGAKEVDDVGKHGA